MNLHYVRFFSKNGKITVNEVKIPVSSVEPEMHHFGLTTTKQLINKWDSTGKSYGCYRYFLISRDTNISQFKY